MITFGIIVDYDLVENNCWMKSENGYYIYVAVGIILEVWILLI
jgi:hypothetical protein